MDVTEGARPATTSADVVVSSEDVVVVTDDVVVVAHVPTDVTEIVAGPEGVVVPDGCARVAPDDVIGLISRWRKARTSFVVIDERGRHAATLQAGRLDLTRAAALDLRWIAATLRRTGYVHLDAGNVPRSAKPAVMLKALAAVAELRASHGKPEYVLVEDAQDVLRHPGVPPTGARLGDGGYHLALR
jgi:hypothetical protein